MKMSILQIGILEIGGIVGAILSMLALGAWIYKRVNKAIITAIQPIKAELEQSIKTNRATALLTLKYSITQTYENSIKIGRIDLYSLRSMHEMVDQYKTLEDDGFVNSLVTQMDELYSTQNKKMEVEK